MTDRRREEDSGPDNDDLPQREVQLEVRSGNGFGIERNATERSDELVSEANGDRVELDTEGPSNSPGNIDEQQLANEDSDFSRFSVVEDDLDDLEFIFPDDNVPINQINLEELMREMMAELPGETPAIAAALLGLSQYRGEYTNITQTSEPFESATKTIELECEPEKGIFEYNVDFSPEVENIRLRKSLMKQLKEQGMFGENAMPNGSGSILYSPEKLSTEVIEATVPHPEIPGRMTTCTLVFLGEKNKQERLSVYTTFLKSVLEVFSYQQLTQMVLRMVLDPEEALRPRLEIWAGLSAQVVFEDEKYFLRMDSSNDILRKLTVYDIYTIWKNVGYENWKGVFEYFVVGQSVVVENQNVKDQVKVRAVLWDYKPTDTFHKESNLLCHRPGLENLCPSYNNHISLEKHLKVKHNLEIKDVDQPLLAGIVQPKNPSDIEVMCLVPEFCSISLSSVHPFHPLQVSPNAQIKWDMEHYVKLDAGRRQELAEWWFKEFTENRSTIEYLKGWGLNIVN